MKSQLLTMAFSAAMTIAVLGAPMMMYSDDAEAKGFSSRSSSFSRSSYRSPKTSYSSSKSSTKRASTSGGFWSGKKQSSKTNKGGTSLKTAKKQSSSIANKKQTVKTKEMVKLRNQQKKFKKPAVVPPGLKSKPGSKRPTRIASNNAYRKNYNTNPVYNRARQNNSSTYYERRNSYYGPSYTTPSYGYAFAPSIGMWDTIFLIHMMNSANAGQFAHHHQNDPDFNKWKEQAEIEAKENAELRAALATMNSSAANLAGTPIQTDYLPEGVDADIALSQGARQSALPDFKVCTGQTDGAYFLATAGVMSPNAEYVNVVPVVTAGTGQTLKYITEGKCDGAWVQANGYWNYIEDHKTSNLPFGRVMSPYREAIHVLCHEDGPTSVSDLDEAHTLLLPEGTGAETTLRDWIGEDDDYADIKSILSDPGNTSLQVSTNDEALMRVSQNKNTCMMYVAAPGTKFMQNAEKSAKSMKVVLIDVTDGDLDETTDPSGTDVYESREIDSSTYPNLTRQSGSFYGSGDVHTFDVAADFIISDTYKKKYPSIYSKLAIKIAGMEDQIKAVVKH